MPATTQGESDMAAPDAPHSIAEAAMAQCWADKKGDPVAVSEYAAGLIHGIVEFTLARDLDETVRQKLWDLYKIGMSDVD